jgi:hypothetical protein
MKSASVTLIRDGEVSPMMAKTYQENIRGVIDIVYTPHHVVFILKDETEVAYKADRIQEFETYYEDE